MSEVAVWELDWSQRLELSEVWMTGGGTQGEDQEGPVHGAFGEGYRWTRGTHLKSVFPTEVGLAGGMIQGDALY
jgi:hypothetical protein